MNSESLKSGGEDRAITRAEEVKTGEAMTTGDGGLQSLRLVRFFVLLAALAASTGCKDEAAERGQSQLAVGAESGGQQAVGEPEGSAVSEDPELIKLFTPAKKMDVPRIDISKYLTEHLADSAKISVPENYDPNKRNLFLIANHHYVEGSLITPERYKRIGDLQKAVVMIFHRLFETGVTVQFLEGVSPDLADVRHDTAYPRLTESPKISFPAYKKSGEIFRASMAVEGTYGDLVRSTGVDEMRGLSQLQRERDEAFDEDLGRVADQIIRDIAVSLGIPVGNKVGNIERLRVLIWQKVSVDKTGLQEKLLAKFVLGNPEFIVLLNKMVGFYHWRSGGRNERMSKAITAVVSANPSDSAFIIGGGHIEPLSKLFPEMNVFVITPSGLSGTVDKESDLSPFWVNFSREDWFEHFLKLLMYGFGLTDEQVEKLAG
ncbi:hypothetical protein A3B60_00810 [Candidatus Peregrinibacteria bacterium RIFCSPLOWO2_01_FULL_39_12]|nr:MAG: hypothetical protein A3B60_00810 [Candidatus Peregrinibacteria bacterium RIFCSPLOWO2_01_FULL_39_12]OGJ42693.1 MAG: hypothetical protein A3I58_00275 [Candidatus Peregrinibacteria bacterium RIFCSPLOWO2_02_FULL_39_10]